MLDFSWICRHSVRTHPTQRRTKLNNLGPTMTHDHSIDILPSRWHIIITPMTAGRPATTNHYYHTRCSTDQHKLPFSTNVNYHYVIMIFFVDDNSLCSMRMILWPNISCRSARNYQWVIKFDTWTLAQVSYDDIKVFTLPSFDWAELNTLCERPIYFPTCSEDPACALPLHVLFFIHRAMCLFLDTFCRSS